MLSSDGRKVLCDFRECGREAVGGCELRLYAGRGGDHITIPGDLVAWCPGHREVLLASATSEYILLDPAQLKAGYITRTNKRIRGT